MPIRSSILAASVVALLSGCSEDPDRKSPKVDEDRIVAATRELCGGPERRRAFLESIAGKEFLELYQLQLLSRKGLTILQSDFSCVVYPPAPEEPYDKEHLVLLLPKFDLTQGRRLSPDQCRRLRDALLDTTRYTVYTERLAMPTTKFEILSPKGRVGILIFNDQSSIMFIIDDERDVYHHSSQAAYTECLGGEDVLASIKRELFGHENHNPSIE